MNERNRKIDKIAKIMGRSVWSKHGKTRIYLKNWEDEYRVCLDWSSGAPLGKPQVFVSPIGSVQNYKAERIRAAAYELFLNALLNLSPSSRKPINKSPKRRVQRQRNRNDVDALEKPKEEPTPRNDGIS